MVESNQITFRRFEGPSLFAPFAAVVVEFTSHFDDPLAAAAIERSFSDLLTGDMRPVLKLPAGDVALPELVGLIANAWQDLPGESNLPVEIVSLGAQRWRIALGFHDGDVALASLHAGLDFAEALFGAASGVAMNVRRLRTTGARMARLAHTQQPDRISRLLIRVARARGVPVYPFGLGSRVWVYGQGRQSQRFFEATTFEQSFLGVRIARDKIHSKRLLARLGFPVAPYGVADSLPLAREIAGRIGYPLVVKPPDRERGLGVTTGIDDEAELEAAFDLAKSHSRSGLALIERHIAGDHFRLSVFGGNHKRNAQHSPATVIGDGLSSVAELIAQENARRTPEEFAAGAVHMKLEIDSAMLAILAKQGYGLDDRPPKDIRLILRKTSNMATGGRFRDATADTHPDTIAMAETVARCFRLDAAGIDFISPDITKSWRDGDCAIIEVNAPPGISSHFLAERVFSEKFPPGSDGRIPCAMVVSDGDTIGAVVAERFKAEGMRIGFAGNETTSLDGEQRFMRGGDLPARILSLLLDPACDALVVTCSARDIENHGLPHARFRVALFGDAEGLMPELRAFVGAHVPLCVDIPVNGEVGETASAVMMELQR